MSEQNVRIAGILLIVLMMAVVACNATTTTSAPTPTVVTQIPVRTSTPTLAPPTVTTIATLAPANTQIPSPTAVPTSSPTSMRTDTPRPLPTATSKPTEAPTPTKPPVVDLCFDAPSGTIYIFTEKIPCANNSPIKDGYDFGVDSSGGRTDWLSAESDAMRMDYPTRQQWGAVFLTVGKPVPPGNRPGQDLSRCQTLQVDLRADAPNTPVQIGMKDAKQRDDGSETKIDTSASTTWETKSFPIASFKGVTLSNVYIPIEFVFGPGTPATIHFRNIRFLCSK